MASVILGISTHLIIYGVAHKKLEAKKVASEYNFMLLEKGEVI